MPTYQSIIVILCLFCSTVAKSQEENAETQRQGRKYIELNTKSLDKYHQRIRREQNKLLKRLSRKEQKLLKQLRKEDSLAYARLQSNPLRYDSIRSLLQADSSTKLAKTKNKTHAAVDSLKKIQHYLQTQANGFNGTFSKANTAGVSTDKLNSLQTDLNYQGYINQLIDQKTQGLKGLGNNKPLTGIQKDVFYARSRMKSWKQLADDPDKAEEKALEWLQGTEGFDKAFQQQGGNNMHSANSVEELEKMGYQTKRQLNEQLQKQFGNNLGNVQQQMGQQIGDWQDQTQGIGGKAKGLQQQVKTTTTDLKDTKQSLTGLKHTQKPSFKINPMRGLPFRERIEKSYTYQTKRATPDGKQPAMLELAGMAGYKHTPKLITGIGISANIGLGQNWNNIRLNLQGIGIRTYASWEWQYGIAAYAGYERQYKQISGWQLNKEINTTDIQPTTHNTRQYSESVLLGLSKRYRMNREWDGAVQLLYDVWWQDKGLRSPIVLRFVTSKK